MRVNSIQNTVNSQYKTVNFKGLNNYKTLAITEPTGAQPTFGGDTFEPQESQEVQKKETSFMGRVANAFKSFAEARDTELVGYIPAAYLIS